MIMLLGGAKDRLGWFGDALFANAQVNAGAIRQFLAGAGGDLFESLLGLEELLLLEKCDGFFVELQLALYFGI